VLRQLVHNFEIVVTNDGSRDRTGQILARLRQTEPSLHLRVATHTANLGYGAALASGFDAASASTDRQYLADLVRRQHDRTELSANCPVRVIAVISGVDRGGAERCQGRNPTARQLRNRELQRRHHS
jgi:glycosyltransferase involved in cell wall biosynthesis